MNYESEPSLAEKVLFRKRTEREARGAQLVMESVKGWEILRGSTPPGYWTVNRIAHLCQISYNATTIYTRKRVAEVMLDCGCSSMRRKTRK